MAATTHSFDTGKTVEGMSPEMAMIVTRILETGGGKIWIKSGFRTRAQQQKLYDDYTSGRSSILAAKPGTSRHEKGNAVDFGGDLALAASLAKQFGLSNTVKGEPWHFSLGGSEGGVSNTSGTTTNTASAAGTGVYYGEKGAGADAELSPTASLATTEAYIRDRFPQAAAFLDVPEIKKLLLRAAKDGYTPGKLQGELQATQWYRSNSDPARKFIGLQKTDPAEAKRQLIAKVAEFKPLLAQYGLNFGNLEFGGKKGIEALALKALTLGWSGQELLATIGAQLQHQVKGQGGLKDGAAPAASADELMRTARYQYLVPMSKADAEQWAIGMLNGTKTEEMFTAFLRKQAEIHYPTMAGSDATPGEFMSPIRQTIADLLELSPESIDFLDPRYADLLSFQADDKTTRPMTIGEAGRWARNQEGYRFTARAGDEASNLAETISRAFGKVA